MHGNAFDDPLSDATKLAENFENIVKLPYFSTIIDHVFDELVSTSQAKPEL